MTRWGYIQGRGGGAAALKPALAKGSVPEGDPVSLPWGGGDMGTTYSGGQVLKRDGKVPCGAARPRERLRAS